jgi:hypothetical protein
MNPKPLQMTYNKLDLLKLMYLSREGDRREGVLHRQSKGWFQVAGMGHEALAVVGMLMQEGDYLFPYYRDRAMVWPKPISPSGTPGAAVGRCPAIILLAKRTFGAFRRRRAPMLCLPVALLGRCSSKAKTI